MGPPPATATAAASPPLAVATGTVSIAKSTFALDKPSLAKTAKPGLKLQLGATSKLATVFNADSSSDEEEIPAEARSRDCHIEWSKQFWKDTSRFYRHVQAFREKVASRYGRCIE